MATYNRAHLLSRAIRSILNQSYENFELIIIDDGSTDNTGEVVSSFRDKRILYYKQEQNKGISAARNRGFDLASGNYITLLDDDDELVSEALETVISEFKGLTSRGISALWLWFNGIDSETQRISGYGMEEEGYISYEDELCGNIQGDFFVVLDSNLMSNEDRFDEECWSYVHLLWLKLYRKSRAYYIPKTLRINHREHSGRVSTFESKLKHILGLVSSAKAFLAGYGEDLRYLCPKRYGEALDSLGSYQILAGQKTEGRRNIAESFRYKFSVTHSLLFLSSFVLSKNQIAFFAAQFFKARHHLQKVLTK